MSELKQKNSTIIAKRWAKAFFELVSEDEGISKFDVLDDLKEISKCINENEELSNAINNPSISTEEKQIVICKLFQNKVMPIVYNFVYSMNLKKRLNIIADIADEFEIELDNFNNTVRVEIVSAIDLIDDKKEYIKNKISDKIKKNIIVNWEVNKDIIGGLIFNINDVVIDNSIKCKLEKLSKDIVKI